MPDNIKVLLKLWAWQFNLFVACVAGWLGLLAGICGLIYFLTEVQPIGFILTLLVMFICTKAALWSTKVIMNL